MPDLAGLVSSDSRPPLQRLRRPQLQQIMDREGLTYPASAPATALLPILEANQISGLEERFADITHFRQFMQKNEDGSQHVEIYPVPPQHHTKDKVIDYDTAMEERAEAPKPEPTEDELFANSRIAELETRNHELALKNADLELTITTRLTELEKIADEKEFALQLDFPLEKLLPWQLIHMARDKGIEYKDLSKEDLIAALRG